MRIAVVATILWLSINAVQLAWGQDANDVNSKTRHALAESVTQDGAMLPDAPSPVPAAALSGPHDPDAYLGPQTFHDKFMAYAVATFGPRALVEPALPAGLIMANPPAHYPREWRQGATAFGRNYGDELVRTATLHTARFAAGALLHEDFRYRPSQSKNAFARTGDALLFTFFDKSDSGHTRLALANFAGVAAGGYVGNAYLPHGWNDATHADIRSTVMLGSIAGGNVMQEFEPQIYHFVKRLHVPMPRIAVLEWWTPRKEHR